jgi:hypothetical protein
MMFYYLGFADTNTSGCDSVKCVPNLIEAPELSDITQTHAILRAYTITCCSPTSWNRVVEKLRVVQLVKKSLLSWNQKVHCNIGVVLVMRGRC